MQHKLSCLGIGVALALPLSGAGAQSAPAHSHGPAAAAIVTTAATIEWRAGPPSLPPGAQFAILEGNPAEAGPITLRLRFPANYTVPPHTHTAIEHITVLEGTLNVGMGAILDRAAGTALAAGGFAVMPIGMQHYVWTGDAPAVLQLHAIGPWVITYVNPEDDPRRK